MIGTTTFSWLQPMPGAVMTTAGRVFLIFFPVVESKSPYQILPRCGLIVGVDGLFDKICLTDGYEGRFYIGHSDYLHMLRRNVHIALMESTIES